MEARDAALSLCVAMWPLLAGCGEASSASGVDAGGSQPTQLPASGAGGSAGSLSMPASGAGGRGLDCPGAAIDDEPGIVLEAEGRTVEFRKNLLWYDGRPPILDLSAGTDAEGWQTFRIVIFPDGEAVVPGLYGGGFNPVYAWASRPMDEYDSVENRSMAVCVSESGTGEGARVSGRFSADLVGHNSPTALSVRGTFSGVIGAH